MTEAYARPKWYQWRLEHRLRRKQLALSLDSLKAPVPFAKFLARTAWAWFLLNFVFYFFNWVFRVLVDNFWWFLAYMVVSILYLIAAAMYFVVQAHWPETTKVFTANSPDLAAADFRPGAIMDSVDLPDTDKPDAPKSKVDVELILHGGATGLPSKFPGLRRGRHATIARATVKTKEQKFQAGHVTGNGTRYFLPVKSEPYVAGDAKNWRGVDWMALLRKHFGKKITVRTIINLALEPADPATWELPPDDPSWQRELYETEQRVQDLEKRLDNYQRRDERRASWRRTREDEQP